MINLVSLQRFPKVMSFKFFKIEVQNPFWESDNLLTPNVYFQKLQVTYLHYIVLQNKHSQSKNDKLKHTKERTVKKNTEIT